MVLSFWEKEKKNKLVKPLSEFGVNYMAEEIVL